MGIIGVIALILRIITLLPSIFSVGAAIIRLLPKFKDGGLLNDLEVIGEILKLILGLLPANRDLAKLSMTELKEHMQNPTVTNGSLGLQDLKDRIERRIASVSNSSDVVRD